MPYIPPHDVWVPDVGEHAGEYRCHYCTRWLAATADNFYRHTASGGLNLRSRCRDCEADYRRGRAVARRRLSGEPAASPRTRRSRFDAASIVPPEFRLEERRFGVEIEFCGATRRAVASACTRYGLRCEAQGYNHFVVPYWKVVGDGSIEGEGGGELVSPPLSGEEGRRVVAVASQALRDAGCETNHSTGLHVHHEVRDLDAASIVRAVRGYAHAQEAIDWLVARSRRTEFAPYYCHPILLSELAALDGITSVSRLEEACRYTHRYRVVNVTSFPNYGTLEFRQHGGTIEAEKILAWVAFGQSMIAAAAAGVDVVASTPENLIAILSEHGNLDSAAAEFLRERARRFQVREAERVASAATARPRRRQSSIPAPW